MKIFVVLSILGYIAWQVSVYIPDTTGFQYNFSKFKKEHPAAFHISGVFAAITLSAILYYVYFMLFVR